MKTFHCTHCQSLVFFENVKCLNCGYTLAYLPDARTMAALEPADDALWKAVNVPAARDQYELCANYSDNSVCNWALPASDPEALCQSCRLTHTIPDLSLPENKEAWYKLEAAKRRLVYTLLELRLPIPTKYQSANSGLEFEFLSDLVAPNGDSARVMTGHDNGLITINVAEADDVYREKQRAQQHEPYRTLLGHFRHEIGHYYWDRLIRDSNQIDEFRKLFGDERADYQQALSQHYQNGPPADWPERFISAYATMHPWEDWAECWAHVMHMVDALESAGSLGLSVRPRRQDEPALQLASPSPAASGVPFDQIVQGWVALTYVLNNLTRGLGLSDVYPFVLSPPVVDKLRFVYGIATQGKTLARAA